MIAAWKWIYRMDLQLEYLEGWSLIDERFQNESDTPIEWNGKYTDENGLYRGERAMPLDFSETLRVADFDGRRFFVNIPDVSDGEGGFVPGKVEVVPIEDIDLLDDLEYENLLRQSNSEFIYF